MERTFLIIYLPKITMVFPPKDYMVALVYEDNDRVITWTDGKGNTYIKCRNKPRNSMLYGISFIEVGK